MKQGCQLPFMHAMTDNLDHELRVVIGASVLGEPAFHLAFVSAPAHTCLSRIRNATMSPMTMAIASSPAKAM